MTLTNSTPTLVRFCAIIRIAKMDRLYQQNVMAWVILTRIGSVENVQNCK